MALEFRNVSKSYSTSSRRRQVLKDVTFELKEGEFACIVGYSGSGKTTLMNLAAGLLSADEGEILFRGEKVTGPSLERALIFQNYSLLPWSSALRNVELAVAACTPSASKLAVTDRARHYLQMVKLGHALDRRPGELSGGMRQRVALARGLAMQPKLLLLDEPLSALDALTRAELQEELMRIRHRESCTVLMITNDVDEAIMLGDRILPMSAGPAATLGEPIEVKLHRPCSRKDLNFDPVYQKTRQVVVSYLLAHGPRRQKHPSAAEAPRVSQPADMGLDTVKEGA
jgi:nitrate/nitrite transport system ATP-binding protein